MSETQPGGILDSRVQLGMLSLMASSSLTSYPMAMGTSPALWPPFQLLDVRPIVYLSGVTMATEFPKKRARADG